MPGNIIQWKTKSGKQPKVRLYDNRKQPKTWKREAGCQATAAPTFYRRIQCRITEISDMDIGRKRIYIVPVGCLKNRIANLKCFSSSCDKHLYHKCRCLLHHFSEHTDKDILRVRLETPVVLRIQLSHILSFCSGIGNFHIDQADEIFFLLVDYT